MKKMAPFGIALIAVLLTGCAELLDFLNDDSSNLSKTPVNQTTSKKDENNSKESFEEKENNKKVTIEELDQLGLACPEHSFDKATVKSVIKVFDGKTEKYECTSIWYCNPVSKEWVIETQGKYDEIDINFYHLKNGFAEFKTRDKEIYFEAYINPYRLVEENNPISNYLESGTFLWNEYGLITNIDANESYSDNYVVSYDIDITYSD